MTIGTYNYVFSILAICGNNASLNAACEDRQCMCNTGDGMICDGKFSIYSMICMEITSSLNEFTNAFLLLLQ